MKSFDYDLRYLKAGVEELESYLLSDHMYWPLDAKTRPEEPVFPNLTLGNLLLAEARLKARQASPEQQAQLDEVLRTLDQLRAHWRVAWSKKAEQSIQNRLKMWVDFIDEYSRAPEANADRYAYEVQRRVMLDLLLADENAPEGVVELLGKLDALVKTFLVPGDFIWEAELQDGFPRNKYWYLYGKLPESLRQT